MVFYELHTQIMKLAEEFFRLSFLFMHEVALGQICSAMHICLEVTNSGRAQEGLVSFPT